jgi:tetratricopeptide (TPR) repeat protein
MHVVVLAYGPAQTTKRAIQRAHGLRGEGGKIVAVAASPAGTSAVAKLNNVSSPHLVGKAALQETLANLSDLPTLLIHDDTVITPTGVAALRRELDNGTRYVVPYTNDPETGHLACSLPIGKAAEKQLDRISTPSTSVAPSIVRSTCILARKQDLESLLVEPIADPYTLLDTAPYGFMVAGGALAAHSTRCLGRAVDKDPDGRPLLVAALIVKDEEQMLPECLESLKGLVDRIEVCDTGSRDRTIEIARSGGAHVIERSWPDSFAVARNYVLDECQDARYILSIDADERVVCSDPTAVRRYLATYSSEHPAFNIEMANLEPDGSETMRFRSIKLFRADDVEYRGSVHEAVFSKSENEPLSGAAFSQIRIVHLGYAAAIVEDKDKVRRNLELAEAEYRDNPGPRAAVHLARTLAHQGGSAERALALLEETWEGTPDANSAAKAQVLNLMADQCVALGDDERAFDLSRQALELVPADDTAAAQLAQTADRLGRLSELITIAERIAGQDSAQPAQQVQANRAIFRSALVAAYARGGEGEKAVTEAFGVLTDYPQDFGAWNPLVECLAASYGAAAVEVLAPMAVKDPNAMFLEPIIRAFPSSAFTDFCVAYHAAGGSNPEVTRVGLLAAAMADRNDAFSLLATAADLDPEARTRLAERISINGRPDLADLLQPDPLQSDPIGAIV